MGTIASLPALKQRLHELNLRAAKYGISADPHITIEARDLDTVISQMNLIEIQRRNLEVLLGQAAKLGTHAPPHILNQIREIRQEVERLRNVCAQHGHMVAAHPLDSDQQFAAPEPIAAPIADDPLAIVRERLRDVESMLRAGLVNEALRLVKELQAYLR